MRIKNSKNKVMMTAIAAVVLIATGFVTYIYLNHAKDTDSHDKSESSELSKQQTELDAKKKQDFLDKEVTDSPEKPIPTPTNNDVVMSAKDDGNRVTILTNLQSVASGLCTLTVRNGDIVDIQRANVVFQPEYSSCAGFSVDKKQLGNGIWSINLSVEAKDISLNKDIRYEVK